MTDGHLWRRAVGICLLDPMDRLFMGHRSEPGTDEWQLPQGGIKRAETVEDAAWRELMEETGVQDASLVALSPESVKYRFPRRLEHLFGRRFIGQEVTFVAFRLTGLPQAIDITGHTQEFDAWRWVTSSRVVQSAPRYRAASYAQVLRWLDATVLARGASAER